MKKLFQKKKTLKDDVKDSGEQKEIVNSIPSSFWFAMTVLMQQGIKYMQLFRVLISIDCKYKWKLSFYVF